LYWTLLKEAVLRTGSSLAKTAAYRQTRSHGKLCRTVEVAAAESTARS
jgi:hypothetical protein